MNLETLKNILTNKLNSLIFDRNLYYSSGDIENYEIKLGEIKEIEVILDKLNL